MTVGSEPTVCLTLSDIDKAFGGNHAVKQMSLTVRAGEILGLIGANGAGKTTLLNLASGALGADRGVVQIGAADVTRSSAARRTRLGLARTFQHPRLVTQLTALENVMIGARARRASPGDLFTFVKGQRVERSLAETAASALRTVGVDEATWLSPIGEIPPPQHRWIEIARCLASAPSVALLDEPTSGFAHGEVLALRRLLESLVERHKLGVVLVTHDVSLAVTTCHRVVVMHQGGHLAEGTPVEILANSEVTRAYLGEKAHAAASGFLQHHNRNTS